MVDVESLNYNKIGQEDLVLHPCSNSWSPNGRKLVYEGVPPKGGENRFIVVADVESGQEEKVLEGRIRAPSFSYKDIERIYYVKYNTKKGTISLAVLDGRSRKILFEIGNYYYYISPMENYVTWQQSEDEVDSLWVAELGGGNRKCIYRTKKATIVHNSIRWGPSEKQIVFWQVHGESADYSVWRINTDGSRLERISPKDHVSAHSPTFSPNIRSSVCN